MEDLANGAYRTGVARFSDFLDLYEQNLLSTFQMSEHGVTLHLSGGYENAERKMAAFIPQDISYDWQFPYHTILLKPQAPKFAEDFSHRDVLGALMNLGIERHVLGDILIRDRQACFFCCESMAEYLVRELCSVRHTTVTAEILNAGGSITSYLPRTESRKGTVASVRLDAVIALGLQLQRTVSSKLISSGLVYVNSRLISSNGYHLKTGDLISVRGYGKLRYEGTEGISRKNREIITVSRFV